MHKARRVRRKDDENDVETVSSTEDVQDCTCTIESRTYHRTEEDNVQITFHIADKDELDRSAAHYMHHEDTLAELSATHQMMKRKRPEDMFENSAPKTQIKTLQQLPVDNDEAARLIKLSGKRSPQDSQHLSAKIHLRTNEDLFHIRKEAQDSKAFDLSTYSNHGTINHTGKQGMSSSIPSNQPIHELQISVIPNTTQHIQSFTPTSHEDKITSYIGSTFHTRTRTDSSTASDSQLTPVGAVSTVKSMEAQAPVNERGTLSGEPVVCAEHLLGSQTLDIFLEKGESHGVGAIQNHGINWNTGSTSKYNAHHVDQHPLIHSTISTADSINVDTFEIIPTEVSLCSDEPIGFQYQNDKQCSPVDISIHESFQSDHCRQEQYNIMNSQLGTENSHHISTQLLDVENDYNRAIITTEQLRLMHHTIGLESKVRATLTCSVPTDDNSLPPMCSVKQQFSDCNLEPVKDMLIPTRNGNRDEGNEICLHSVNEESKTMVALCQDEPLGALKSEHDEKKSSKTKSLMESYKLVGALKVKLLLEASKVHYGKGGDRLFADYWDSMCRYLSTGTYPNTSMQTYRNCDDRDLNGIEVVLKSFLSTKRLRILHNQLILELMKLSSDKFILKRRCINHIPKRWYKNIAENPTMNQPTKDNEIKPNQRCDSIEEKELFERIDGYLGASSGTWTVSGDIHPHKDTLFSYCNQPIKSATSHLPAPTIPGVLEISSFISRYGTFHNVKMTDRAIDCLSKAVKEQTVLLLRRAILSIEETKSISLDSKFPSDNSSPKKGVKHCKNSDTKISPPRTWKNFEKQMITPSALASSVEINPPMGMRSSDPSTSRLCWERCILSTNHSMPPTFTKTP